MDALVRKIGRLLGKEASYLGDKITLRRSFGQHPNWGADIGSVTPYELSAAKRSKYAGAL